MCFLTLTFKIRDDKSLPGPSPRKATALAPTPTPRTRSSDPVRGSGRYDEVVGTPLGTSPAQLHDRTASRAHLLYRANISPSRNDDRRSYAPRSGPVCTSGRAGTWSPGRRRSGLQPAASGCNSDGPSAPDGRSSVGSPRPASHGLRLSVSLSLSSGERASFAWSSSTTRPASLRKREE